MNTQNSPKSNMTPFAYEVLYKIYKYVSLALTAITCVFGALSFYKCSEECGNYLPTSPLTNVFCVILVIDVIFAISAMLLFKKAGRILTENKIPKYFSLIPAAAATYCLVTLSTSTERGVLDIFLMICAALTLLFCISRTVKLNDALALCAGYGQVIFGILLVARIYLDSSIEMNAPTKLLLQFAAITVSFSTLSDIRVLIDKSNAIQFVSSKALVACLCPVAFIAVTTLQRVKDGTDKEYLCFALFLLAYAACEIVKLFTANVDCCGNYYEDLDDYYVSDEKESEEQDTI